MSTSAGFIVSVEDELTFYDIKRFIESLKEARLIYCTRGQRRLYIKTEEQVLRGDVP